MLNNRREPGKGQLNHTKTLRIINPSTKVSDDANDSPSKMNRTSYNTDNTNKTLKRRMTVGEFNMSEINNNYFTSPQKVKTEPNMTYNYIIM